MPLDTSVCPRRNKVFHGCFIEVCIKLWGITSIPLILWMTPVICKASDPYTNFGCTEMIWLGRLDAPSQRFASLIQQFYTAYLYVNQIAYLLPLPLLPKPAHPSPVMFDSLSGQFLMDWIKTPNFPLAVDICLQS